MKRAAAIAGGVAGITGVLQVLLGLVFWIGYALALIPLHMIVGLVFVLALLTLSVMGFRAGAPAQGAVGLVLGLIVLVFGMTQAQILPGPSHWIIRVLHLVLGVVAMSLARRLAVHIQGAGGASHAA